MAKPSRTERETIVVMILNPKDTDQEILKRMRLVEACSDGLFISDRVCYIGGFDNDSPELYKIPKVRAFCRRLVSLGYLCYLTPIINPEPEQPTPLPGAWGAREVWLCSEDRMPEDLPKHSELTEEFIAVLAAAKDRAKANLGALNPPT